MSALAAREPYWVQAVFILGTFVLLGPYFGSIGFSLASLATTVPARELPSVPLSIPFIAVLALMSLPFSMAAGSVSAAFTGLAAALSLRVRGRIALPDVLIASAVSWAVIAAALFYSGKGGGLILPLLPAHLLAALVCWSVVKKYRWEEART